MRKMIPFGYPGPTLLCRSSYAKAMRGAKGIIFKTKLNNLKRVSKMNE